MAIGQTIVKKNWPFEATFPLKEPYSGLCKLSVPSLAPGIACGLECAHTCLQNNGKAAQGIPNMTHINITPYQTLCTMIHG